MTAMGGSTGKVCEPAACVVKVVESRCRSQSATGRKPAEGVTRQVRGSRQDESPPSCFRPFALRTFRSNRQAVNVIGRPGEKFERFGSPTCRAVWEQKSRRSRGACRAGCRCWRGASAGPAGGSGGVKLPDRFAESLPADRFLRIRASRSGAHRGGRSARGRGPCGRLFRRRCPAGRAPGRCGRGCR